MNELKEALIFTVVYGLIAILVAVIINVIWIKLGKDINKEEPINGNLIGLIWPLSLIIILGFTILFMFEKLISLLSIRISELLKLKEVK